MSKGIFITGTGTDVGKTYVTGLIVKKLHDAGKKASGITQSTDTMCPYVYETAVSPHLASRLEGNPVVMEKVLEG